MRVETEVFEIRTDRRPLVVKATPYTMHTMETRFRVSVNNGPVHIFAWDDDLQRWKAIESSRAAGSVHPELDEAIGQKLNMLMAA